MKEYINDALVMPVRVTESSESRNFKRISYAGAEQTNEAFDRIKVPYLKKLRPFIEKAAKHGCTRFQLITQRKIVARKAALYILSHYRRPSDIQEAVADYMMSMAMDQDVPDELEDLLSDVNVSAQLEEADLKTISEEQQKLGMVYNLRPGLQEMPPDIFVTGLEDGIDLEAKIEAIRSYKDGFLFIWVSPEHAELPVFKALELMDDHVRVKVDDPDDEYYMKLFESLARSARCDLDKDLDPIEVVNHVKKVMGIKISEESIDRIVQKALKTAGKVNGRKCLSKKNLIADCDKKLNALDRLYSLTGLEEIKQRITEELALSREINRNGKLRKIGVCRHMIFTGNPGTGKTTVGKLYSDCMAEAGLTNGVFLSVAREDLVAKYVGQSAPKVGKAFREAAGGILWVDEAGFLIQRESGGFVDEVLKEFIRYMEIIPVTVIFAMYETECEELMKMDAGLRSRISQVVKFKDYSMGEIKNIATTMYTDRGYGVDEISLNLIRNCMSELAKGEGYGNARDVRRLVEASIRAHSVALYTPEGRMKAGQDPDIITAHDVREGIKTVTCKNDVLRNKHRIGFAV